MLDPIDIAIQFEKHLNSPKQTWLLGAGISGGSNVPLMNPLTDRVLHVVKTSCFREDEEAKRIIAFVENDLDEHANIEDFLTHLNDLISMAGRARSGDVVIQDQSAPTKKLVCIHRTLRRVLSETVRWGYRPQVVGEDGEVVEDELVGTSEKSIVSIEDHLAFIGAIFGSTRAGLEEIRSPVEFFTTNYDTLLEDALALSNISYQDGFVGGGVAYWDYGALELKRSVRAIVTKLHGSIDWYRSLANSSQLYRIRSSDNYPAEGGTVMIYPQAMKYLHAQQDPFSALFRRFRRRLESSSDQVLLICGYSFGDEHINSEIKSALSNPRSQLTVVTFARHTQDRLPKQLDEWRRNPQWGNKVFVASPLGLYQGASEPVFGNGEDLRDWWTFAGVTQLLLEGFPVDVLEQLS